MKTLAAITKEQSLVDFLIAELDEIYYPGYSEEIMSSLILKSSTGNLRNWKASSLKNKIRITSRLFRKIETACFFLCS